MFLFVTSRKSAWKTSEGNVCLLEGSWQSDGETGTEICPSAAQGVQVKEVATTAGGGREGDAGEPLSSSAIRGSQTTDVGPSEFLSPHPRQPSHWPSSSHELGCLGFYGWGEGEVSNPTTRVVAGGSMVFGSKVEL